MFLCPLPKNKLFYQQAVITAMQTSRTSFVCQVSLGLKEVQKGGGHDFKLNMVPFVARNPGNINVSRSSAPKRCCLCQVLLGLKDVLMGAHHFILNMMPLFARKSVNINVSLSAAQKLALVPASSHKCYAT